MGDGTGGTAMRITYDKSVDASYIYLGDPTSIVRPLHTYPCDTRKIGGMINLDFDADGRLFGVEVIGASKFLFPHLLRGDQPLRIQHFTSTDTAHLHLSDESAVVSPLRTYQCDPEQVGTVHLEFDANDRLVGVKAMSAGKYLCPTLLQRAEKSSS